MTVREKSRLDKFKLLLASPSTDLGKLMFLLHNILLSSSQLPADWSAENLPSHLVSVPGPSILSLASYTHMFMDADLQERLSDVSSVVEGSQFRS